MSSYYRPEIDGLRAVAIIPVVVYHASFSFWQFDPFQGGYLGVDVFFVISGYLIASLVLREVAKEKFSYSQFYARRIRRLFPALLATLSVVFLLGYFFFFRIEAQNLSKHLLSSLLFVQNINLVREIGYFDNSAESVPLLHLWSLSVEEQFYLFFPPLLLAIWRWWPAYLLHCFILLGIISLAGAHIGSSQFANSNFYLLPTRGWELLAGVVLAKVELDKGRNTRTLGSSIAAPVGLLLVVGSMVVFHHATPHPSLLTIMPVIGTMLVIWGCTGSDFTSRLLQNPIARGVGLISYPLYLWHAVFFTFAIIFLGGHDRFTDTQKILCIVASVLASVVTYQFIERPLRFRMPVAASLKFLAVWAFLLLAASGLTIGQNGVLPGSFANATKKIDRQFEGALWRYTKNDSCMERYPVEGSEKWKWFFCYLSKPAAPEVVLIGSSFANQYVPLILQSMPEATLLSFGTCDLVKKLRGPIKQTGAPCSGDGSIVQAEVIDEQILSEPTVKLVVADIQVGAKDFIKLLARRLGEIRERTNVPVVLMLPHARPQWKEVDTKSCFGRPVFPSVAEGCKRELSSLESVANEQQKLEFQRIADAYDQVYLFDPNPTYCNSGLCDFAAGNLPVFRDPYHHLSRHGNSLMSARFTGFLKEIGIQ